MRTMGDDFEYQYAESWFKQMDKLIHYVNKDGRVTALYSTPSVYTGAKNSANKTWSLKTDDYFPNAASADTYWTGYFTSRPTLEQYVCVLSGYYLVVRQLEFLTGRKSVGPQTFSLGDALGIAQHHDAIIGTAKQDTTNDYAKRLAVGASEAEAVANLALSCLTDSDQPCATPDVTFSQCSLLNISCCPSTEEDIPEGKSLVVVSYNPIGWSRIDIVRVPVNSLNLSVKDSTGNTIGSQFVEMDNATKSLRSYTKAYLGVSVKQAPKYWLLFRVSVPPLGWNTYFIVNLNKTGELRAENLHLVEGAVVNDTVEIGPGDLKMSFSLTSGQLKRLVNSKTGVGCFLFNR